MPPWGAAGGARSETRFHNSYTRVTPAIVRARQFTVLPEKLVEKIIHVGCAAPSRSWPWSDLMAQRFDWSHDDWARPSYVTWAPRGSLHLTDFQATARIVPMFPFVTLKADSAHLLPLARKIVIVLLCVAAGAVYAISVLPVRVLNPFDISWITGDAAQSYLGWLYFRREERLTLPLGWATTLGYPLGAPIAYTDSIPPIATALWFFRDLLPADFQYLGVYFVACCVLQCYFGFRICRTFAKDNTLICILGAMFFLTSAVFTWRAKGHFALASHWLILAALERFLNPCRLPSTPSILCVGALCFLAGSISPYITVMVLLIVAAAYMRMIRPVGWSRMAVAMTIAVGGAATGLLLFGFLQPLPNYFSTQDRADTGSIR